MKQYEPSSRSGVGRQIGKQLASMLLPGFAFYLVSFQ
jgi:hypothetical protein